ncbi:MAG: hypothetical protein ACK4TR_09020 [Phenylobacterium sp.]|uniref:hypothetical protein n=1 Tax=Phenylobacterium sp. TaxID=1871053 RepID=UPI00391BAF07
MGQVEVTIHDDNTSTIAVTGDPELFAQVFTTEFAEALLMKVLMASLAADPEARLPN